jgi:hypothetical protein
MSGWIYAGQTEPAARKEHTCYLCDRAIPKGSKHVCRSGIVSGEGRVSFRMHFECERMTRDWDEMDWETFTPGDFDALLQGIAGAEVSE